MSVSCGWSAEADMTAVPGLRLLEEWIDGDEERRLLATVDAQPWDTSLRRRRVSLTFRTLA
jgi:hypothetical protein